MNKLTFTRKFGIIFGILLIFIGIGLLFPGLFLSDTDYVSSEILSPVQSFFFHSNVSEIRIISNGDWHGMYETYYKDQQNTDIQYMGEQTPIAGTGNKNFKINGNYSQILIHIGKEDNNEELTVELVINGEIVEKQSVTDESSISINHHLTWI